MASLKEVKNRIASVTSTQQITSAMKMVAAAKLKRAQDKISHIVPYAQRMMSIFNHVATSLDGDLDHAYDKALPVEHVLLVVISSDRGLCGAFNSNAFKAAQALVEEQYATTHRQGRVSILPIGKKAYEYFDKKSYPIVGDYYQLLSHLSFDQSQRASQHALSAFAANEYQKVILVYNESKNVATQILRVETFLPTPLIEESSKLRGSQREIIFEPSKQEVFDVLLPSVLHTQFYKAVLQSNAAEQGARMTAMDQATDNAGEMLKQLKLTYNRTRQAAITKEILEIVGGAEALASEN